MRDDQLATQALQRRVGKSLLDAHTNARGVISETAQLGLERHEGKCLVDRDLRHVAGVVGDPSHDLLLAWTVVDFMLRTMGHRAPGFVLAGVTLRAWPGAFGVCECCTRIHRRTRAHQRRCRWCRKRPPAPAVLGFGHGPITRVGEPVTIRVDRWLGQSLEGWKNVTIGLCKECGEPFHGHSHKKICGSGVCRGRRDRRVS